jgi:hypothetical protein
MAGQQPIVRRQQHLPAIILDGHCWLWAGQLGRIRFTAAWPFGAASRRCARGYLVADHRAQSSSGNVRPVRVRRYRGRPASPQVAAGEHVDERHQRDDSQDGPR